MAGCLLADDPSAWDLYEQGRSAEKAGHMSQAYLLYSQAAALDPRNKTYWLRSQAVRSRAAMEAKPQPSIPQPADLDKELAELIRKTPGCVTTVVSIGNEAYNRLHQKMRSVNTLLAWGHARVIENLMGQRHRMNPTPVRAISDQFASNKETVAKALMPLGWEIELVQKHRAEEDLAVAAASILARQEFVTRLAGLGREFEMELPRGASAAVDAAAKEFIAKYGAEGLPNAAKMHFRTALRAQGLPEPPKTPWRRTNAVKNEGGS